MVEQKEFDRVSVPTFVHIQSATNHSWPTNVLCNAKQISGTPLSALTTELRDPNTKVGLGGHLGAQSVQVAWAPRASPEDIGLWDWHAHWCWVRGCLSRGCAGVVWLMWHCFGSRGGGWSMCGVNK